MVKYPSGITNNLLKPVIYGAESNRASFTAGMNFNVTLKILKSGNQVAAEGSFATALTFYSWVRKQVNARHPVSDYTSSRRNRKLMNEYTNRIMVRVINHRVDLSHAPDNRWLEEFYPDNSNFLMSLPDFLGMNGARQWYEKGITYNVLGETIHPFYGVYFPTRTEHLTLFSNWLSTRKEDFGCAVDIGTGCGILSLLMAKCGIKDIYATDINPNAVYSTIMETERHSFGSKIRAEQGSLFGSIKKFSGLTVFNPPWIPGEPNNLMDRGIYYEKGFFENFIRQADLRMQPESTLAIIFSNFAIEAGITDINPIEEIAGMNKNFIIEDKLTHPVTERSPKGTKSWVNRIRENEVTELWILKKGG